MLLTYVDESYDTNYYWMAALVVPEAEAQPLARALDAVTEKAASAYPVSALAELHGHAILQAKDDWSAMANAQQNMIRARIAVYRDALKAIAGHDIQINVRGLDVPAHRARYVQPYPPHQVVLGHLLERVNEHAVSRGALTLVIADEVDGQDDHRQAFRSYQQEGTGGYLSSTLPAIVDTIHFAPSKHSRLLQAVDLIAYLHRRLAARQDHNERARHVNEKLWSSIQPRLIHSHCWCPETRWPPCT